MKGTFMLRWEYADVSTDTERSYVCVTLREVKEFSGYHADVSPYAIRTYVPRVGLSPQNLK
jgi:hypothetical protein